MTEHEDSTREAALAPTAGEAVLYVDVGSPYAYLAAERAAAVLGAAPRLQPVLLGGLFKLTGRSSWALGDAARRNAGMAEIEARALRYGLPPLRWPEPWPGDYLRPMRVVTAAWLRSPAAGEAVLRAGFRRMFVAGEDLAQEHVLRAATADAGQDPGELLAAAATAPVKQALRDWTGAAHARGVFGVPTLALGERLLWGDDRLDEAAPR
ncbi:DsbA family protein [Conexibacter sp. JD483]|uniref:DsbA family protein n=1 Tax=unclassified Conexibacter TaxID=2627773 RepID=UPI0027187CF7|nr:MULTISPECIES: DsbA family protein [unclassified Conexibacter]MDO8185649.1 DsbA family protein [Conexibacter sp. CPCC 205706]MDO8198822.1 DsbA family protein [Conexibacter sp. CPCC 205762]MDR9367828.1 DsbA family protein [Conexibacter sp. JD483]